MRSASSVPERARLQPDRRTALSPGIAIVGATASGKTGVGLLLAEALETEIIGVDSRQIYRRFDIGTAKPTPAQRRRVHHHLVDVADPEERFSAGRFRDSVAALLPAFAEAGRKPLFVGGTGLYLRAVFEGLCPAPAAAPHLRSWLAGLEETGGGGLHRLLSRVDPSAAERIHVHDRYRIIRALEVYFISGTPLSQHQEQHRASMTPFPVRTFGLSLPLPELDERIALRLRQMVEEGFLDEVRAILESGCTPDCPAFQAVGYPQFAVCVRGECTLEEACAATIRATRQYARRQRTWFRGRPDIQWIEAGGGRSEAACAAEILERLHRERVSKS